MLFKKAFRERNELDVEISNLCSVKKKKIKYPESLERKGRENTFRSFVFFFVFFLMSTLRVVLQNILIQTLMPRYYELESK